MITEDNYKDYETLHEIKNNRIYYKDKVKKAKYSFFIASTIVLIIVVYKTTGTIDSFTFNELDKGLFEFGLSTFGLCGVAGLYKVSDTIKHRYNLKYFKKDHPDLDTEINDKKLEYELGKYKRNKKAKDNNKNITYKEDKLEYITPENDFWEQLLNSKTTEEQRAKVYQKTYK